MKYKSVFERDPRILDKEVNKLLSEGWKLYGSPFDSEGFIGQAMVKDDEVVE